MTGENSTTQSLPLDFPLKDVTIPPPLSDYVKRGETMVTTLKNGVVIASETSAVCMIAFSALWFEQVYDFVPRMKLMLI